MKKKYLFIVASLMLVASCAYDVELYNIIDPNYTYNPDDDGGDDGGGGGGSITYDINSVAELIAAIKLDDQDLTMAPGKYYIEDADTGLFDYVDLKVHDNALDGDGDAIVTTGGTYSVCTLLNFSGSNSTFDLDGVQIYFNTSIFKALKNGATRAHLVLFEGHNNTVKGLEFISWGNDTEDAPNYSPDSSPIACVVQGIGNTIEDLYLLVKGSYPYGYGYIFGKSSNTVGVTIRKQSSLLIAGSNTTLKNCTVVTQAFGHGIVIQGAQNTLIEDCYVQGTMRSTDDILANDPLGLCASTGNYSQYPPHNSNSTEAEKHETYDGYILKAGEMICLSEDGVRTYGDGNHTTTNTATVTVKGTTIKNMRGGFHLEYGDGIMTMENCTTIGCQTQGFTVEGSCVITGCKSDAMYAPAITNWYNKSNATVEVALMPDQATDERFRPYRIAEINGSYNDITLTLDDPTDPAWATYTPLEKGIVLGESYYYDIQASSSPVAISTTLVNETGLPIYITNGSYNNTITTDGTVEEVGAGSGNSISYTNIE